MREQVDTAMEALRFNEPPDLPGGNSRSTPPAAAPRSRRFNEAAGFTRRKRLVRGHRRQALVRFMRPPDLPGGNAWRARSRRKAR